MAITDLTGTTWYVPSGWSASSGFGKFSITGSYSYTWISSGNSFSYEITNDYTLDNERCNLIIGYDYDGFNISQKSNCICVYEAYSNGNNAFQTFPNPNAVNITITFTGGTDVTNADLIAWLSENGELQEEETTDLQPVYKRVNGEWVKQNAYKMTNGEWVQISEADSLEITDLTGTTWYVPIGWSTNAGYGDFSINGSVYFPNFVQYNTPENAFSFNNMKLGYEIAGTTPVEANDAIAFFNTNSNTHPQRGISNAIKMNITFESGSDVSNPALISWLYANGELQ